MNDLTHAASFPRFRRASIEEPNTPPNSSLRAWRRHYAYLLSNLPGVVYRCEAAPPWRMQFVSSKVLELSGRRREEFEQGLAWAEIIHPEDLETVTNEVAQAIERFRQFDVTYRIIHASGATVWVHEQGRVTSNDPGYNSYLEGFIQDVTRQRLLEQSLRAAEVKAEERASTLDSALESTTDYVCSLNENWQLTYVNSKASEHFGGGADLLGRSLLEFFPDDRPSALEDCVGRAIFKREPAFGEDFVPSRQRWYRFHAAPTPGGVTVFFSDVTKRRELEEIEKASANRWRATLNMIPQMVWSMAGGARQPDYYNDRWYDFTGLPRGSVQGPEWVNVFHPDDRKNSLEKWRASRASGCAYEAEYRVRNRAGEYRWVVSRGNAEKDAAGQVVRWYGTCTDVHERFLDQAALVASDHKAKTILNSVPQVIWCADHTGALEFISDQWSSFIGSSREALLGKGWRQQVHPADRLAAFKRWSDSVRSGRPYQASFRIAQANGRYLWVLASAVPEHGRSGKLERWFGTCTNIDKQVTAQEALADSEATKRSIIEASPDCISLLDTEGTVLYVNAAAKRAYGPVRQEALIGSPWGVSFQGGARARARRALEEARAGGLSRFVLRGGPGLDRWYDVAVAPVLGSDGAPKKLIVTSRDFTERKEAEDRAQWAANHDPLTSLPNRFLFNRCLEQELANAEDEGGGFSLLLFDVDHLKHVNDAMGHDAGDALLKEVAERLSAAFRGGDTISRLGGDEFAVLLPRVESEEELIRIVGLVRERLTAPFSYAGRLVDCQASAGASIFPTHGSGKAELMKSADIALYVAKKFARGQLRIFAAGMRDHIQRRLSMLSLAKSALSEHRVVPFYQPKIDLKQGTVRGFEALLRWRDKAGNLQLPGTIAAAFEDAELASTISDRMMELALDDVALWSRKGISFGHVALNAGAVELRKHNFVDVLLARLEARAIPPRAIQIEVTETVFLGRGSEHIHEALRRLSHAGIKIALDDFGTGFASLSHLNDHPVDLIKIDGSFIKNLASGSAGEPIVDAVISLGQSLGIEVVAEGIENAAQHAYLKSRGCEYGQGFFYRAAVPADEVRDLVSAFSMACIRPAEGAFRNRA